MEVKDVRRAIANGHERLGLSQVQFAERSGITQGHLSRIEDVENEEMNDIAARIVFQLIERGLQMSLSDFFRQLESGRPLRLEANRDQAPTTSPAATDERIDTLLRRIRDLGERVVTLEAQRTSPPPTTAPRRSAPTAGLKASDYAPRARTSRRRDARRASKKRPRKP